MEGYERLRKRRNVNTKRAARTTFVPERIVSGGQTGADRAGLDWAIAAGVPHGGWCPKGRRAEDGAIPRRYRLRETPSRAYSQRTRFNVRDSDGTVIISVGRRLRGGSALTYRVARELGRPVLHLGGGRPIQKLVERLQAFVERHRIGVLNVAGPRASGEPTVDAFVQLILACAFGLNPRRSLQIRGRGPVMRR